MLDEANVLLTASGHLIVESFDHGALTSLRVLDAITQMQREHLRPCDPGHDYVPVTDIDEGLFYQSYLYWVPAS